MPLFDIRIFDCGVYSGIFVVICHVSHMLALSSDYFLVHCTLEVMLRS